MNLNPLSKKLFIEKIEQESKMGNFVIPDSSKKETNRGVVRAVGSKITEVKIDDMVLFKQYGPDEIEIDRKKYLIGEEEDILAIIN